MTDIYIGPAAEKRISLLIHQRKRLQRIETAHLLTDVYPGWTEKMDKIHRISRGVHYDMARELAMVDHRLKGAA